MRIGIIIQARLGSTRLPEKMILPFFEGKGILEILLTRIKENIDTLSIPLIIATTINPLDDAVLQIGNCLEIPVVRGSEDDVLDRFILAASTYNISKVIRVCADNPLLDMKELQRLINIAKNIDADYHAFATKDLKPTILTNYGFWAESISLNVLKKISLLTSEKKYREHVTNFVYTHPDQFKIHFECINPNIEKHKNIRLTVDTLNDFSVVQEVYKKLLNQKSDFRAESIVQFVAQNPLWLEGMKIEIESNKK